MSETPKTDALRALMAEIYEPDNAALDHMLEKYAELERETTRPEALRSTDEHFAERLEAAKKLLDECLPYHGPLQLPHELIHRITRFVYGESAPSPRGKQVAMVPRYPCPCPACDGLCDAHEPQGGEVK